MGDAIHRSVAFTPDQESSDYKTAYALLAKMNLLPVTPGLRSAFLPSTGSVCLPSTTVMGTIQDFWTAEGLRDVIKVTFRDAGVHLSSIFCGVCSLR